VHPNFERAKHLTADNLLVISKDLLPECFAPTDIFAKLGCSPQEEPSYSLKKGGTRVFSFVPILKRGCEGGSPETNTVK
jgi:hypothetical protein